MMNENYNTPNSGCCGRPFPTAPENKCNYNDCCMNEYAYKQKACIRNKQPDCESQAVIPSITVETVDGITNLANCLVHVMENNTTYYVDDKHRILITWSGPVNIPGYDMEGNPNNYKNQIVTDVEVETAVIYDNHGKGYIFGITPENLQQAVNDRLDEMAADGTLENLIAEYIEDVVFGFDTVADMKASTDLRVGDRIRTLGFHALNDGGGAYYKITDTGTANEMDVIAVGTGLYANIANEGVVSPEQLGCYNDQTHDDGIYIQSVIDISKDSGVHVRFGHSIYYVSTPINIPLEYSIDFQGVTLKAISATNFSEGMINVKNTLNIHNGVISNLKLNQNNLAPKAIYLDRSWRKTFENIEIKNTPTGGYGIYIDGTNGGSGGNQFSHITGDGNYINSTFIYNGANDNIFTHVDYRRYSTGIEVNGFARLFDIHGYASSTDTTDDWFTNSTFIKITSSRIMADELYPDTHNFCFYNYSALPSQIGKIFFTYNENISQQSLTSVMFKADNDNVELYYRWRVESIVLSISSNVSFELIKNSTSSTLSSYLHLGSISGSATYAIDKPPVFVNRILPMNNFTKLGIYEDTLIATGTCQYAAVSSGRDICETDVHSGYKLIDGYYAYKGINPDDDSIFDGTVKVENNRVTVLANTNQKTNFQFFIQVPAQEANIA